jgi:type II secretory ATPase GspE/PulE/Tfp pilus assembly ATPase PilB-like protein
METVLEGRLQGSGRTRVHLAPEGIALRMIPDGEVRYARYDQIAHAEMQKLGRRSMLSIRLLDGDNWQIAGLHPLQARYGAELIHEQLRAAHQRLLPAFNETLPRPEIAGQALEIGAAHAHGIVELVDFLLAQGAQHGASDIHIEPFPGVVRVRYRVDGTLVDVVDLPGALRDRLFARLKVIGRLTIYRNDIPQEGRMMFRLADRSVDVRISMLPTIHGEKAVLRIFDPSRTIRDIGALGMSPAQLSELQALLRLPQGAILLTGPSNSGKTTTLYAALQFLHAQRRDLCNICTVEDPVEYDLGIINQTQVNADVGLTFAAGLRTVLRQDPEVIMIGEIRDGETAGIAIRAGLTGHLILSTVHAPSAPGVFARLVELGAEPFLVASAVTAVLAQRLIRRVCPACARPSTPSTELFDAAGIRDREGSWKSGAGCEQCYGTGYQGRTGVFHVLRVTEAIRERIVARAPAGEVEEVARRSGAPGLRDVAIDAARCGATTLEEAVRVCGEV